MRTPSPYLPWNKVAGSALLLGVAAYLWAEGLGALKQLSRTTWQTDLAAFFAITALLVVWADRSLHSRPLRIAYLSLVTLGVAAAVAGSLRAPAASSAPAGAHYGGARRVLALVAEEQDNLVLAGEGTLGFRAFSLALGAFCGTLPFRRPASSHSARTLPGLRRYAVPLR